MSFRRALQPRSDRTTANELSKAQNKYFLNDDIDTQQWEDNIENDPVLPPPSSKRTSKWNSQRRVKQKRLIEEEEADSMIAEEERSRKTPSPELYDPFYQSRPRSARPLGFESLPEPEDLVDETCNHPEYPSDLDFTHSQDQRDEFEFSVEAAIEDVEVTGTSIARIGSEISKAADMVNVDKLFGLREELENKLENYKRELNRLHNKVKIVGGSVQTVRM